MFNDEKSAARLARTEEARRHTVVVEHHPEIHGVGAELRRLEAGGAPDRPGRFELRCSCSYRQTRAVLVCACYFLHVEPGPMVWEARS